MDKNGVLHCPTNLNKNHPHLVGGAITILKNISQSEGLSHILWKIKNV